MISHRWGSQRSNRTVMLSPPFSQGRVALQPPPVQGEGPGASAGCMPPPCSPQPCWFSQTLHLSWACSTIPLSLAHPYKSVSTPEGPHTIPAHRATLIPLCFDVSGNTIWETNEGLERVCLKGSLEGQNGNAVHLHFLRKLGDVTKDNLP